MSTARVACSLTQISLSISARHARIRCDWRGEMHQQIPTVILNGLHSLPELLPELLPRLGVVLAMFAFGAYHGLNPGMGWLFALSLGLQQRSERAIWVS